MSESASERVVSKQVFKSLIQLDERIKKKNASNNGELGERVRNQVENGHLHAGAFRVICALNRKEEDKRNDFIRSLRLYLDMADELIWDGDTHTGDMVDDAEEREAKENEAAAKANAAAIEKNIKPLSDEEAFADQEKEGPGETADGKKPRRGAGRNGAPLHH